MKRLTVTLVSSTALTILAAPALAADGADIVQDVCGACHQPDANGDYSRIDAARRTPEGWEMNIERMVRNYGVHLSDQDRATVIRYLADTRGLSIEETEGYRYILEREPFAQDQGPDQLMTDTCGRCHSYARVALQRHSAEDWEKLLHFHLGQFPALEYQALARDRDWWVVAQGDVLTTLTQRYVMGEAPEKSDADLSGTWQIAGRQPGRGDYHGTMTVTSDGDAYAVTADLIFADGAAEQQTGRAILYGAGEWRASLTGGGAELRQVMALRADGTLEGRWFHTDQSTLGGRIMAARGDDPRILSVSPDHIRNGETTEIRIIGTGLTGAPALPDGLTAEVVSQDTTAVVLRVTADAEAPAGRGPVSVGDAALENGLAVFGALDHITVEPPLTYSRIGDGGGPIAAQPAVFDAIGWLNGPDGQPGTEDDIRVGTVHADWRTENFDEAAAEMKDAQFTGTIGPTGIFSPAAAGPNPERPMRTNNAGNLSVIATVTDGNTTLEGKAHLYATVQRFVDPPIR
ncbi:MAG: quinohemoprotein amine dehydrogenase subunit alpha [Paracoccus sp. (in: a-proteobacteria)]|nr:quinohemoprotein amine dehydrogenase subunit alpha [Paracoccus sp. (in: a-proteobacteria)]